MTLRPAGELGVLEGPLPPIPGATALDGGEPLDVDVVGPVLPGDVPEGLSTGPRGEFVVEGVPPGRLAVHASHPAYAGGASRTFSVGEGQLVEDLEVVLHEGARVAGRIVDTGGYPIGGAIVELRSEDPGLRLVTTGPGGEFAFEALSGTVTLRVSAALHEPETITLPAESAAEVELVLRAAFPELPGRVADDRGFPVGHAAVRIVPLSIAADPVVTVSDGDGTFAARLPAGVPLEIEVRHPDFATLFETGVVADAREGLALSLGPAGGVEGTVRAARGGFAVAPFDLVLVGDDGSLVRRRVEDLDGHFVETGLAPGRYRVRVQADGYAPWTAEIEVPPPRVAEPVTAPAVEVDLEAALEAGGVVTDARGDPVPGVRLRADRPVRLVLGGGERPTTSDADGRFTLAGLPARRVAIWATHPTLGTISTEVDLERGAVDDVRLAFEGTLEEAFDPAAPARFGSVAVVLEAGRVVEVLPGSKAERAGLREGDLVRSVDGTPAAGGGLSRTLRGPPGTEVLVEVVRGGRARTVRVARELVFR